MMPTVAFNELRSRFFFANKKQNSNNNFRNNNGVNNPPKKKSNWSAAKTNSPKLETFLTSVERDLFCNAKPNDSKITFLKKKEAL